METIEEKSIQIFFNGQPHRTSTHSLVAYLKTHGIDEKECVATAINGEFIAKEKRGGVLLKNGDQVLTFKPIVGG